MTVFNIKLIVKDKSLKISQKQSFIKFDGKLLILAPLCCFNSLPSFQTNISTTHLHLNRCFAFVGMYGEYLHVKLTSSTFLFFKYLAMLLKYSQKEFALLKSFF